MKSVEFLETNKICLLLTSTINPKDFPFVGRKGKGNREKDCMEAINFYIKKGFRIVFIDNSNFKSEKIIDQNGSNLCFEYLSFESTDSHLGKGHGELEIIDFALKTSKYLESEDFFLKISGRYIIDNIEELCKGIKELDYYHYCNFSRDLYWADTRFMILTKSFFSNYFKPACSQYLNESDGVTFEKVYARAIHAWMAEGGRIKLLPSFPFYRAFNGVTNKKIQFNLLLKIKYTIYYKFKKMIFKQFV